MNTEKTTTHPFNGSGPSSRTGTPSGSHSPYQLDRREGIRHPVDASDLTTHLRRPTESHWEWIIDRATD
ncbi:MAG TPA: hypothetical protein VIU64_04260 [Polyangia bacterium]